MYSDYMMLTQITGPTDYKQIDQLNYNFQMQDENDKKKPKQTQIHKSTLCLSLEICDRPGVTVHTISFVCHGDHVTQVTVP